MFYFRELLFRVQYFFFSFLLTVFLCYLCKSNILILLSLFLLNISLPEIISTFSSFIYTHPVELLRAHFLLILIISFIFLLPLFLWNILDFIKSSLKKQEYNTVRFNIISVLFSFYIFNFFCFFCFFSNIWFFFENFNPLDTSNQTVTFFFELKVQEYFYFILDFLYLANSFFLFFLFLIGVINFFGINNLFYLKKLFIFINLLFATLLSPPEISTQLFILILLTIIFEVIVLIYLYFYFLKKNAFFVLF